tara:strand:+ start:1423 stop:1644 length:222 start_codon:yes stop_codon:yes gene_type:complete
MKTFIIRAERKLIGYYSIKAKSLEEAKRQAKYQMAVSPKTVTEWEKQEEIILPQESIVIQPYNEFTGKDKPDV